MFKPEAPANDRVRIFLRWRFRLQSAVPRTPPPSIRNLPEQTVDLNSASYLLLISVNQRSLAVPILGGYARAGSALKTISDDRWLTPPAKLVPYLRYFGNV